MPRLSHAQIRQVKARMWLQFLSADNFAQAWAKVAANQGCAGVDGESIAAIAVEPERVLRGLRRQLRAGQYRPLPLRQFHIPKRSGGSRCLAVPTVRDRIVQQALLQVLHPVMDPQFETSSYAYRPGRSHHMAVDRIRHLQHRGYDWVLDADIIRYFDHIQHSRLLAEVQERLDLDWVLALVHSWLTVGILTPEGIVLPQQGVPQGAVISPILANVYLDDFDELIAAQGYELVRYADDFVVLGHSQAQLAQVQSDIAAYFQTVGLQLHPDKTRLTQFEQGFRFLGHAFVGDLVVPVQRQPQPPRGLQPLPTPRLVHAEASAPQPTVMQQALVSALKAAQAPIPPPLYVVLGYAVRGRLRVAVESQEVKWSNGMSSVYVVEQGTCLQKEQGRLLLKAPKEPVLSLPWQEVERILLFGSVQLSTSVVATCLAQQIPVIFLSQMGEYKGHLWSAESVDSAMQGRQFAAQGTAFGVGVARGIVAGKLWNSKLLLLRQNRKQQLSEVQEAVERLQRSIDLLLDPKLLLTVEQIRGYEGAGAAQYFQQFTRLIRNPGFSWQGRNFHPPLDPVNSLLSFGYTLLFNNVFSLLLAEGLNPYLGHLHGAERQKAYLAFDLMEEFRSPIVDSLVLRLVNQKIIRPTDFTWPRDNGGVYLLDPARRIFLKHFEQRITETVSHPDVQEPVTYRRVIQLQVLRYRRALMADSAYESFRGVR